MSPVSFTTLPQMAKVAPYLTAQEWKDAPTGVDPANLIIGGTQLGEDAQLAAVILRASSWINAYCGQILAATQDIEMGRLRANRRGEFIIHPMLWPVLEVTDVQVGATPSTLSALDLTNCWVDRQMIVVPTSSLLTSSSVGPLQFAAVVYGEPLFARYTYINGYPVTTLSAQASSGQATITVADRTGIYAGITLQIYDDTAGNESGVVAATPTTNTVTLTANLAITHASGLPVTSLPPAVKEACILLTSALIRTRGNEALVMDSVSGPPSKVKGFNESFDVNVAIAKELLDPYKVIR